MPANDAFLRWRQATPLRKARVLALPDDAKKALAAQPSEPTLLRLVERLQTAATSGKSISDALMSSGSTVASEEQARMANLRYGEAKVLADLQAGRSVALGFEEPRRLESGPVEVPHWVIETAERIDWEAGTLKAAGLKVVELRVAPADDITKTLAETRRVGRPALAPHIEAAFEALLTAGKIDLTASMKSHHGMIRRWLQVHRPDLGATDEKPGDEAIRKTIAPLFAAARDGTQ